MWSRKYSNMFTHTIKFQLQNFYHAFSLLNFLDHTVLHLITTWKIFCYVTKKYFLINFKILPVIKVKHSNYLVWCVYKVYKTRTIMRINTSKRGLFSKRGHLIGSSNCFLNFRWFSSVLHRKLTFGWVWRKFKKVLTLLYFLVRNV